MNNQSNTMNNQSNTMNNQSNSQDNTNDIDKICDTLIDYELVFNVRYQHMNESFEDYKRADMLLGYFSQLRDYTFEYECLTNKVLAHRRDLMSRYKDLLIDQYNSIFKQLLISPTKTEWYQQGINKYKKVKNYSTYYYRRKLYVVLENEVIDMVELHKLIDTIVSLDKYYDIYDETINFFMITSDRFETIMRKNFSEYIHL